jgi:hypothetical protein
MEAGRRRSASVQPAGVPISGDVKGVVLDATTGSPVAEARVEIGSRRDNTDSEGKFTITAASGHDEYILLITRTGYATQMMRVAPESAASVSIVLTPGPTVSVRTTGGAIIDLDADSITFGFTVGFGSIQQAPYDQFCKPDGTSVTIDRLQIRKIVGPATLVSHAPCCTARDVLKVRLELKDGSAGDYYFADACDGYPNIHLFGRHHLTGEQAFIKFSEIAEAVFPEP